MGTPLSTTTLYNKVLMVVITIYIVIIAHNINENRIFATINSLNGTHVSYNYNKSSISEFNMTEATVLDMCIALQITAPSCSMIYGGINTENGEPKK